MGIIISQKGNTSNTGALLNTYIWTMPTPSSNSLIIMSVFNSFTGATPATPTITGAGITWTQIATVNWGISSEKRITLFRGLGNDYTGGNITFSWGSQAQDCIFLNMMDATGVVLTGTNGSDGIVQSATNSSAEAVTQASVTLSPLAISNRNAVLAIFSNNNNPFTGSPGTGYTELVDSGINLPDMGANGIYRLLTIDTSPYTDMSPDSLYGAIALELKSSQVAGLYPYFF